MKGVSEKTLERKFRERCIRKKAKCLKLPAGIEAGLPDRLVLLPVTGHGLFAAPVTAFAEIKTTGKKPTPIQRAKHEELGRMGYRVFVIDSNETLEQACKELNL